MASIERATSYPVDITLPGAVALVVEGERAECPVCLDQKDLYRHTPLHSTFCTDCKVRVLAAATIAGHRPQCPVCRAEIRSIDGALMVSPDSDLKTYRCRVVTVIAIAGLGFFGIGMLREDLGLAIFGAVLFSAGAVLGCYSAYLNCFER